jgi:ATP-binding protein involved in chromosome partitioning
MRAYEDLCVLWLSARLPRPRPQRCYMPLTKENVRLAMGEVRSQADGTGPDLVTSGALLWSSVCDTYASVKLELPAGTRRETMQDVAAAAHAAMVRLAQRERVGLESFIAEFVDAHGTSLHTARFGGMKPPSTPTTTTPTAPPPAAGHTPIPGLAGAGALADVRHIIAVGAGKGGVGKSSIALNLAVGLARRGHSVGLLDGDIYGPSMPTMLGLAGLDAIVHQGLLQPFVTHGIKCMTIGKLVDAEKPLIWRGPMAHGAFKQLTEQTAWGELDYLIIDLPPGTGDVSLTMAQLLKLTGAVVVCTPQRVAQDDAVRAAKMFQQLGVPLLGVVENMSGFVADDGTHYDIFGKGGAEQMAQRLNVPFLGAIPITMGLRIHSDTGNPTANFMGTDASGQRLSRALESLVTAVEGQVALATMRTGERRPTLTIS